MNLKPQNKLSCFKLPDSYVDFGEKNNMFTIGQIILNV